MRSFLSRGPLWTAALFVIGGVAGIGGVAAAAEARVCALGAAAPPSQSLFQPEPDASSHDVFNVPGSRVFMHRGAGALVIDVRAGALPSAFARDVTSDGQDKPVLVEPLASDPGRFKITWPLAPARIIQRLTISDGRPATTNRVTIFAVAAGALVPADSSDGASTNANELRNATVSFALPSGLGCLQLRNLSVSESRSATATFTPGDDGLAALRLPSPQLVKIALGAAAAHAFTVPYAIGLPSSGTISGSLAVTDHSVTPSAATLSNLSPVTIGPVALTPTGAALTFGSDPNDPSPAALTLKGSVKLGDAFGGASTGGSVTVGFSGNALACTSWTFDGGTLLTIGGEGTLPKLALSIDPATVPCGTSTFAFNGRLAISDGSASPQELPFRARYENGLHLTAPDGTASLKLPLRSAASIRFGILSAKISDVALSADPSGSRLLLSSKIAPALQNIPELAPNFEREYTFEIGSGAAGGATLRARCPDSAQPERSTTITIGDKSSPFAKIDKTIVTMHCTESAATPKYVDGLSVLGGTLSLPTLGAVSSIALPCFAIVKNESSAIAFAPVDGGPAASCGKQNVDGSTITLVDRGANKAALTLPELKVFDKSALTLDELALTLEPATAGDSIATSPLSIRLGASITLPAFLGDGASVRLSGYRLDLATFHRLDPGTYQAPTSLRIAGFSFVEKPDAAPLFQRCGDAYLIQGRMLLPEYLRGGDRRVVLKQSTANVQLADVATTLSATPPPSAPLAKPRCASDPVAAPVAAAASTADPVSSGPAPPSASRILADANAGLEFFFKVGKGGIQEANVTSFHNNDCTVDTRKDDWITLGPVNLCIARLQIQKTAAEEDIQTDMSAVITFNAFLTKGQRATVDAAFDNHRFRGHATLDKVDARFGSETVGLTALDIAFEPMVRRIQGDVVVTVSQLRGTQFYRSGIGIEETRTSVTDPWKPRLLAGKPDYGRTAISFVLNFLGDLAGALGFKAAGLFK